MIFKSLRRALEILEGGMEDGGGGGGICNPRQPHRFLSISQFAMCRLFDTSKTDLFYMYIYRKLYATLQLNNKLIQFLISLYCAYSVETTSGRLLRLDIQSESRARSKRWRHMIAYIGGIVIVSMKQSPLWKLAGAVVDSYVLDSNQALRGLGDREDTWKSFSSLNHPEMTKDMSSVTIKSSFPVIFIFIKKSVLLFQWCDIYIYMYAFTSLNKIQTWSTTTTTL